MKKLLFCTFWLISSACYGQLKIQQTGKFFDLDAYLSGWEKIYKNIPHQYIWNSNLLDSHVSYVEKKDTNEYVLPFKGDSSFVKVKEFDITNKDSIAIVSVLTDEDEPLWASEIIEIYSNRYKNIRFEFSGTLTVYYIPYLNNYLYVEMFAEAAGIGTLQGDNKEREFYNTYMPLRGFIEKDKATSITTILNSLVGGKSPYHIEPKFYKYDCTRLSLGKRIYMSEENRRKIKWEN